MLFTIFTVFYVVLSLFCNAKVYENLHKPEDATPVMSLMFIGETGLYFLIYSM